MLNLSAMNQTTKSPSQTEPETSQDWSFSQKRTKAGNIGWCLGSGIHCISLYMNRIMLGLWIVLTTFTAGKETL